jgi:hypothetical protein
MPTRDELLQRAINQRIARHVPSRAWNSTVSVVVAHGGVVHHTGTASLYQIADHRFVVTARHVLQRANEADKTVGISGGSDDHFVALPGTWIRSEPPEGVTADPYDLAVHRLSREAEDKLQEQRFLRLSDVGFDDPGPKAVFTIFGFPGIWSKSTGEHDEPMSVRPLELTTYAYDGDTHQLTDYEPRLHLLLAATPEYLTAPDGMPMQMRDRFGQEARFPIALKGVSGCSVWHIGNLGVPVERWGDEPARLAGVTSGVNHWLGTIKVTRWIAVNTLIYEAFPALRPVFDLHLH